MNNAAMALLKQIEPSNFRKSTDRLLEWMAAASVVK